jgi:hypothetical protein
MIPHEQEWQEYRKLAREWNSLKWMLENNPGLHQATRLEMQSRKSVVAGRMGQLAPCSRT